MTELSEGGDVLCCGKECVLLGQEPRENHSIRSKVITDRNSNNTISHIQLIFALDFSSIVNCLLFLVKMRSISSEAEFEQVRTIPQGNDSALWFISVG